VIIFVKHMVMTYHLLFFIWYSYDEVFAKMPCGTYHFWLALMFDLSKEFARWRDFLTVL
jgi:hypothetical protein